MKKAIAVYLDFTRGLLQQFACLYTSYQHINCKRDTDLVVFGPRRALDFVPNDCVQVELDPLSGMWDTYRFINSLHCVVGEHADILNDYDYLLRTDVDTFLTPAWNTYFPTNYTVGQGGYCNSINVTNNIKRVAELFQLRHQGVHNMGSTHFGRALEVRNVCALAETIIEYLLREEFAESEGRWPDWYRGVASMYGAEIALNHLIEVPVIRPNELDVPSTSTGSIHVHPHVHCWHTDNLFSKFQYGAGKYDDMVPDTESLEVRQYCLRIALEAKQNLPALYI